MLRIYVLYRHCDDVARSWPQGCDWCGGRAKKFFCFFYFFPIVFLPIPRYRLQLFKFFSNRTASRGDEETPRCGNVYDVGFSRISVCTYSELECHARNIICIQVHLHGGGTLYYIQHFSSITTLILYSTPFWIIYIQCDLLSLWLSMIEILMFLFKSVSVSPRVHDVLDLYLLRHVCVCVYVRIRAPCIRAPFRNKFE